MPFITQSYLTYLESLLSGGGSAARLGGSQGSEPPPASMVDPYNTSLVPAGPPSSGGPGSYPSLPSPGPINDQFPLPSGGATPPPPPGQGLEFPGSNLPVPPPGFTGTISEVPGGNVPLTEAPPPPGPPGSITDVPGGNVPLVDQPDQGGPMGYPAGTEAPPGPPGVGEVPGPPGLPNIGSNIGDFFGNLGQFFNNIFNTDPTPNIAPSGSPVGSSTPDAQFPGIPLPGASVGGVGPGGSFGNPWQIYFGFHSPGFQNWMKQNNINPHEMLAALSGHGGSATTTGATQGAEHSGQQIHGV